MPVVNRNNFTYFYIFMGYILHYIMTFKLE